MKQTIRWMVLLLYSTDGCSSEILMAYFAHLSYQYQRAIVFSRIITKSTHRIPLKKQLKTYPPLPSALNWSFKTEGQIVGDCAVTMKNSGIAGARIVFGSYDTNIYCLETSTGKLKWEVKTWNFINGSPRLVNGEICVGGCDVKLRFIAPKTGRMTAAIDMGSYIPSSPAISGSRCVVSLYTGKIVCVDAESHEVAWR